MIELSDRAPPYQKQVRTKAICEQAVLDAGADGLVISGAGSTLLALTRDDRATAVESALKQAWTDAGISVQTKVLQIDHRGAAIEV